MGTKADLPQAHPLSLPWSAEKPVPVVSLSSRTGGSPALEEGHRRLLPLGGRGRAGEMLTNAGRRGRQAALEQVRCPESPCLGMTPDAGAGGCGRGHEALGELTGRTLREDVTARIFERFCGRENKSMTGGMEDAEEASSRGPCWRPP